MVYRGSTASGKALAAAGWLPSRVDVDDPLQVTIREFQRLEAEDHWISAEIVLPPHADLGAQGSGLRGLHPDITFKHVSCHQNLCSLCLRMLKAVCKKCIPRQEKLLPSETDTSGKENINAINTIQSNSITVSNQQQRQRHSQCSSQQQHQHHHRTTDNHDRAQATTASKPAWLGISNITTAPPSRGTAFPSSSVSSRPSF